MSAQVIQSGSTVIVKVQDDASPYGFLKQNLIEGANTNLTFNDNAQTVTIAATGGGSGTITFDSSTAFTFDAG